MRSNIHNLSLKGLSGIVLGIISILFIWLITYLLNDFSAGIGVGMLPISYFEIIITVLSIVYILLCLCLVILINRKRRKKAQLRGWELISKRIFTIFMVFLLLGGISVYFLISSGNIKIIIPLAICLFGIFCTVIRNYANGPASLLGILFVGTAIISFAFPTLQFLLWGISFGGLLIIYAFHQPKKIR